MEDYIQIGIDKGLISLNEDRSRITYVYQKKGRDVVLSMKCVRDTAKLYFGGSAGQQRVPSYLLNIDIPLSPKGKQKETTTHVYEQIQRAKALQEKSKCLLDDAMQEVERINIGKC